jgi:hypothetical protein
MNPDFKLDTFSTHERCVWDEHESAIGIWIYKYKQVGNKLPRANSRKLSDSQVFYVWKDSRLRVIKLKKVAIREVASKEAAEVSLVS